MCSKITIVQLGASYSQLQLVVLRIRLIGKIELHKFCENSHISVTGPHSKILDAPPPLGPNFFNFMQFLGNLAKSYVRVPTPAGGLAPSPRGDSGFTTEYHVLTLVSALRFIKGLEWLLC